ncbi:MAG TPA: cold-shock protein [Pseudohongiella sp.]|nr:cold-shock protein [Pseudohongiella sp.]HEA62077.1 cold-shock protein [Pseudohongiella sp.]
MGATKPAKKRKSAPRRRTSNAPRELGNVKWFNASKGFGFITRDSGDDVFVHFRSIQGEGHRVLKDGQRVEFSVSQGDKGLQADDVAAAQD